MPRRLFLYTENHMYGGLERFLFDLIEELDPSWSVVLLANSSESFRERLSRAVSRPLELVPVPLRSRHLLAAKLRSRVGDLPGRALNKIVAPLLVPRFARHNVRAIERLLRARGAGPEDVLHAVNGGYPGADSCACATIAARRAGIGRVVYTVLSVHDPAHSPRVHAELERRLLRCVDTFTTNSEAGRRSLVSLRGFPADRIETVWTAVEDARVDPDRVATVRARWAAPGDVVLGCVGAVYSLKGHRYAVEAMPAILASHPKAKLVIVGDGELRRSLERRARALGVDDRVVVAGLYPGPILEAVAGFDVLVHPSWKTEGLPYAILEAMSLRKPVIISAIGGASETIEDGITGLSVPPADPAAIGRAAIALLSDPERRRAMGEAGWRRQQMLFRRDVMAARLAELYDGLHAKSALSK